MTEQEVNERVRAAATRLLALIDHHDVVRKFRADWAVLDRSGDAFAYQVDRLREALGVKPQQ